MNDRQRIDLYRQAFRLTGSLTLSQKNADWLCDLAVIGLEAKRGLIIDTSGMPEAVIMAFDAHKPPRRQRRPSPKGPTA